MNAVERAPSNGELSSGRQESAGDGLHTRIVELIDESSGFYRPSGDWRAVVTLELVEQLLAPEEAELRVGEVLSVQTLNLALYRMSYEAALACEHARQLGGQVRLPATGSASTGSDDSNMNSVETVGQLARVLCLRVIDACEARDLYDYAGMQAALDACDDCLPSGCTLKSFRVFECLRAIAQAGLSRGRGGSPPSRRELDALAGLVSEDRDLSGTPYADYALLLLVTAVGHMQRGDLVDNAVGDVQRAEHVDSANNKASEATSLAAWVLDVLQGMEDRGAAQAWDWPIAGQPNPQAHHVHYYRHFAHHILAMALAHELKEAAATQAEDTPTLSVADVKREYSKASVSLERALQLVPASNEARWRYYDLNAENLEHEEGLRIELLEQRLSIRQTVKSLAEANVDHYSKSAQEELRSRMADVSMRIVEVIGIFLAVVAILGVTITSATVDGLTMGGRILLLTIGGLMPVVYFVVLRWIVSGKPWAQRSKRQGPLQ